MEQISSFISINSCAKHLLQLWQTYFPLERGKAGKLLAGIPSYFEGASATLSTQVKSKASSCSPSRADRNAECPPSLPQFVFPFSAWSPVDPETGPSHSSCVYIYIQLKSNELLPQETDYQILPYENILKILHVGAPGWFSH